MIFNCAKKVFKPWYTLSYYPISMKHHGKNDNLSKLTKTENNFQTW